MTPALIASSRVRYSLTETFSLAARRVKKKLISMAIGRLGRTRIAPEAAFCRSGGAGGPHLDSLTAWPDSAPPSRSPADERREQRLPINNKEVPVVNLSNWFLRLAVLYLIA